MPVGLVLTPDPSAQSARIQLNVFDGTRQIIPGSVDLLVTIIDGNQKQLFRDYLRGPSIDIDVPFYDNLFDRYTVVVSASGYRQAGFQPVHVSKTVAHPVDVMLIPSDAHFNFRDANWRSLQQSHPELVTLLSQGAASGAAAENRYTDLLENHALSLASFFNLATAMDQINLQSGTPLDYLKAIIWTYEGDTAFAQDRFFGWCDPKLIDQVRLATPKLFAPELSPQLYHKGATGSWKQIRFGETNVQLTFHENDRQRIDGLDCVMIEPDIDYYKDPAAHVLFEGLFNTVTGTLTDPKQVYVLRWMAGRQVGAPGFDPPYTLVA
jgi:hypothetical protein